MGVMMMISQTKTMLKYFAINNVCCRCRLFGIFTLCIHVPLEAEESMHSKFLICIESLLHCHSTISICNLHILFCRARSRACC